MYQVDCWPYHDGGGNLYLGHKLLHRAKLEKIKGDHEVPCWAWTEHA
jgi:hypothetical protein